MEICLNGDDLMERQRLKTEKRDNTWNTGLERSGEGRT